MRWSASTAPDQPPNPGLTSGLPRVVQGLSNFVVSVRVCCLGSVVAGDLRSQDAERIARKAQDEPPRQNPSHDRPPVMPNYR
jgi:hypothetical protein